VINRKQLVNTLTRQTGPAARYEELGRHHNALVDTEAGDPAAPVSFRFQASGPGCAGLAVIVWSESRKRVVSAWLRRVLDAEKDARVTGEDCGEITAARPVGPISIPWFDTSNDPDAVARLVFIDFGEYSIGSYSDNIRGNEKEPISWVVQNPLRKSLAEFGDFVNARVNSSTFDFRESSNELAKILFSCRDTTFDCGGREVLVRLRDLAVNRRGTRVQVSFRDIASNGTYYIPIHLLEVSPGTGKLLARELQFSQPFPVPKSARTQGANCVREWSAGLIVADVADSKINEWRKDFLQVFTKAVQHKIFTYSQDLDHLRDDYFHAETLISQDPEGLLLFAHHGDGDLSDRKERDAVTRI